MLDVICIGGATRDIFLDFPDFEIRNDKKSPSGSFLLMPYGEKIVSSGTYYSYGGGSHNSAVAFKKLGLSVAPFCNIGSEGAGSLVIKQMKKIGINTSIINRDGCNHTGLSFFIIGKDNEHTAFLERGANDFLKIKKVRSLKKTKWFYLSSLTGESTQVIPRIFDIAEKENIKVAWNPGSQQLEEGYEKLKKYIEKTEIIILNLNEAEELVKSKNKKIPNNKRNLIKEIEKMGAKISIVTEGAEGAHASTNGNIYSQNALSKKILDTTGAGDSFGSTFTFGIISGHDIRYALKIAAINSASVVSKMGASEGLLSYNMIRRSKWL